jgi:hypothetical protein
MTLTLTLQTESAHLDVDAQWDAFLVACCLCIELFAERHNIQTSLAQCGSDYEMGGKRFQEDIKEEEWVNGCGSEFHVTT